MAAIAFSQFSQYEKQWDVCSISGTPTIFFWKDLIFNQSTTLEFQDYNVIWLSNIHIDGDCTLHCKNLLLLGNAELTQEMTIYASEIGLLKDPVPRVIWEGYDGKN